MDAAALIAALASRKDARRATFYVSPDHTIRVSRPHRAGGRRRGETFVVTVGEPNYRDRQRLRAGSQKIGFARFDPWPAKAKTR